MLSVTNNKNLIPQRSKFFQAIRFKKKTKHINKVYFKDLPSLFGNLDEENNNTQ